MMAGSFIATGHSIGYERGYTKFTLTQAFSLSPLLQSGRGGNHIG
jgi:hypothetical protein